VARDSRAAAGVLAALRMGRHDLERRNGRAIPSGAGAT
jgi:hypothetical protein